MLGKMFIIKDGAYPNEQVRMGVCESVETAPDGGKALKLSGVSAPVRLKDLELLRTVALQDAKGE